MSDFDPNIEPETYEQANAYVNWCADNCVRAATGEPIYRTALRIAHWMLVVACAPLHLDDEVTDNREALLNQLAMYQQLARALERQREHYAVERLITLRSSLDCWEPLGHVASNLLHAAKSAVSALLLIELHPLFDLWDLHCPELWDLLSGGLEQLADWQGNFDHSDVAIRPDEMVIAKFTWQRAHSITRQAGIHVDMGPN